MTKNWLTLCLCLIIKLSSAHIGGELFPNKADDGIICIIEEGGGYFTGTKISENAILTAAHCVEGFFDHTESSVVNPNTTFKWSNKSTQNSVEYSLDSFKVKKIYINPFYNTKDSIGKNVFDIAVIIIEPTENFKALKSYRIDFTNYQEVKSKIVGYGQEISNNQPCLTRNKNFSEVLFNDSIVALKSQQLTSFDFEKLSQYFFVSLAHRGNILKTGGKGDSGGPALKNGKIIAVCSFIQGNKVFGQNLYPMVYYTKIYSSEKWIKNIISYEKV